MSNYTAIRMQTTCAKYENIHIHYWMMTKRDVIWPLCDIRRIYFDFEKTYLNDAKIFTAWECVSSKL